MILRKLPFLGVMLAALTTASCFIPGDELDPNSTLEAERIIAADADYRRADDICRSIPVPHDSILVGKARLFNSVGIGFFFQSEDNLEAVERYYTQELIREGWREVKSDRGSRGIDFRNNDQSVSISLGGISSDVSYSVWCKISIHELTQQ